MQIVDILLKNRMHSSIVQCGQLMTYLSDMQSLDASFFI